MKINVECFKRFMKKATLNFSIETVQINYNAEENKVTSKMKDPSAFSALILSVENDIFKDVKEDLSWNFTMPKSEIKPFLDLLDEEEVPLKINKKNIVLNNELKLYMDDPSIISVLDSQGPKNLNYFVDLSIDDDFYEKYKKIKKIGNRFGKVYWTVKDNQLLLETTDKINTYSNGVNYNIDKVDSSDLTLCFDYMNFVNMMSVIEDEYSNFKMKIAYIEESEGGVIYALNGDKEQYFLMSQTE